MFLLTAKPILYIANISEDQIGNAENEPMVKQVKEYAAKEGAEVIPLCVKIEEELSALEGEDKKEMLEAIGLEESGLDKLINEETNMPVHIAETPLDCVVLGAGKALENFDELSKTQRGQ